MFELATYHCPDCGLEIHEKLADAQAFECSGCRRRYQVLLDESTRKAGFVRLDAAAIQEPLGLPKGSVRAVATLTTAGCCWVLMAADDPVPGYLLSLLLAVIGYYFGFRQKLKGAGSRILDASAHTIEPLHLPGGSIRLVLILGFAACGTLLWARRQLVDPAHLEFFIVLAGLVVGYFFARFAAVAAGSAFGNLVNHTKGFLVLIATAGLAVLLLTGTHAQAPRLGLTLACFISFYFGSRS